MWAQIQPSQQFHNLSLTFRLTYRRMRTRVLSSIPCALSRRQPLPAQTKTVSRSCSSPSIRKVCCSNSAFTPQDWIGDLHGYKLKEFHEVPRLAIPRRQRVTRIRLMDVVLTYLASATNLDNFFFSLSFSFAVIKLSLNI